MQVVTVFAFSLLNVAGAVNLDFFRDPKDVALKTENVFETTARACTPSNVEVLLEEGYLKSQQGEDQCLFSFFNGLCGGRYMEMGALDGVRFSNTYGFYASPGLDWRGVNVELTPENYEKLIINRPLDIANVHAAVCDVPQTLHYVDVSKKVNAVSGIWEFASDAHKRQWFGSDILEETVHPTTTIECNPLQNILDQVFDEERVFFDFYSLDVEGAELSVLKSIDFDRTGFGILVVEGRDKAEDNREVIEFLSSKGYDQFTKNGCGGVGHRNLWYINRNFSKIYENVLGQPRHLRG